MDQQPSYNPQSGQQLRDGDQFTPGPPTGDGVDWNQAEQYLRFLFHSYQHQIASSMDHVNEKILPLMKKVRDGERSEGLYKEILNLSTLPHNGNGQNGRNKPQ